MRVWRRYLLLQIPGSVLVGLLLWALYRWVNLPLWIAAILYGIYVGKDFLLYPYLRPAYETDAKTGLYQLIGLHGIAQKDLNPEGHIRIQGELWRARAEPDTQPIPSGSRVRVLAAQELTLLVSADPEKADETHPLCLPSRQ